MFMAPTGVGSGAEIIAFKVQRCFKVNKAQAAMISNDKELSGMLTITDNVAVASGGAEIFSTGDSDCTSVRVTCGVVCEIETTVILYGIGSHD